MKQPSGLSTESKAFWRRHAKPLMDAQILTERDYDSFVLLCKIAGMIAKIEANPGEDSYRTMNQFVNLSKQYQALAKQFGLLPRERKLSRMEMDSLTTDEFGL